MSRRMVLSTVSAAILRDGRYGVAKMVGTALRVFAHPTAQTHTGYIRSRPLRMTAWLL